LETYRHLKYSIGDFEDSFPELKENPIMFQTTRSQISKIKYCLVRRKYLGYQITDNTVIELPLWWVEKTFPLEFLETVKDEAAIGRKHFFDVPVGDSFIVVPTMDISKNPDVAYQQHGEPSCVFSSFASALKYLKYSQMSELVIQIGEKILSNPKHFASRRIEALMSEFKSSKNASRLFWKYYGVRRTGRDFDLFGEKPNMEKKDILLIILQQKNNSQSHAVAITGEYIFDSNVDRALPFTLDGINCCCEQSEFIGVAKGYWMFLLTDDLGDDDEYLPLIDTSSNTTKQTMTVVSNEDTDSPYDSNTECNEYFLL
jgi:hypothetical protein